MLKMWSLNLIFSKPFKIQNSLLPASNFSVFILVLVPYIYMYMYTVGAAYMHDLRTVVTICN